MQQIAESERFEPRPDPRPHDEPWPEMNWPIPTGTVLTGTAIELTTVDPAAEAPELFRALDHDRVWAHLPWRPSAPEQLEALLRERDSHADWHVWTVRSVKPIADRPAGAIVGITSYLEARPRDAGLEIGFTVYVPSVWGTVVNPEAKSLLLDYAFETLGAARVQLKTDVRNQRSQQAIARLGAQYEGTLRRQFRRGDGTLRDSVLFSITVDDWPKVKSGLTTRIR
ncbi:GNAT family N-acetyltransferase [Nocardia acidivorans]|uniref:GNAT family N-acetyltransferase n=1 Tax=Nocardia acidivorans TaxID=404580 RepID=UPI000B0B4D3A|nr:GNAT family protein [Nocardia acidivorans]